MKGLRKITLAFVLALGLNSSQGLAEEELRLIPPYANRITPLEFQVEGGDDKNFRYLAAQCWMPPSGGVRGILCVVLHPDGVNGRVLAEPEPWRKLAAANQCALLGISIVEPADPTRHWFQASQGSGQALLAAIEYFAKASGHAELAKSPIALAGVCAAGQFAYEFAAFAPSRAFCFVTIGGAKHDFASLTPTARVPGLLVVTPDRGLEAVANLNALKTWGAALGLSWTREEGTIDSYDVGQCQPQVALFLLDHLAMICRRNGGITSPVATRQRLFPSNSSAVTGLGMGLSFLGKPLQALANISEFPPEVKVSLDKPSADVSFIVRGSRGRDFDEILIPSQMAAEVRVARLDGDDWRITLIFDPSNLPSGNFQVELPVRFYRFGRLLLGGAQVPIRGTVERDIYPSPRTVRFSLDRRIGKVAFNLKTRSGEEISDMEVESVHPAEILVKFEEEGSDGPRVVLAAPEETKEHPKPIAGYIILRARSTDIQRVKIPFYGSLGF